MTRKSQPPPLESRSRMLAHADGVKVNRSVAWSYFGRLLIEVQAPGVAADADWAEFMADAHRDPGETILVVANETKLSPKQRAEVQAWQERHGTPAVVVTDSMITRGVVKALNWFGVKIQAFARSDFDRALDCACIASIDHADAKALIRRMTAALEETRKQSLTG